jgi:hypothetical protein
VSAPAAIAKLAELVPEFREHYPLTIVMDGFADRVAAVVRDGSPEDFLERAFAFVERVAATRDARWEDLVIVCFLEAAPWGALGAKPRMGPETLRVLAKADRRMVDPELW